MVTQNLNQYSREDLENVLIVLKDYRNSLKQIGKRSELSHPKHKQAKFFRVEHTAAISQEFLEKFFDEAVEKFFPDAPENTERRFVQNEKIIGGIRIFYGDDMVDLSFQDFAHTL